MINGHILRNQKLTPNVDTEQKNKRYAQRRNHMASKSNARKSLVTDQFYKNLFQQDKTVTMRSIDSDK